MRASDLLIDNGWHENHVQVIPGREAQYASAEDLELSSGTRLFLQKKYPTLYLHQRSAIQAFLEGKDTCLTTGTASGKSLAFFVAGLEAIQRSPNATVLVMYPLKALGREQAEHWESALKAAGLPARVGRIDGQVEVSQRTKILKNSRVLVMTPDVIHAWLLSRVEDEAAIRLLRNTALIVVDEIHTYAGVFGSNAALLFRRLQYLMGLIGNRPQYLCASATISDANTHLQKLFGREFHVITQDQDTSPKHETTIRLVTPPGSADILTESSRLLAQLANRTDARFIAFVDSRKQVEHLSSIVARGLEQRDDEEDLNLTDLARLDVLPFRAGYEQQDRDLIQDRLRSGSLRGVISTSALELGIDIPFLDTGILMGVPRSLTSFYQRVGRIGRHKPGEVIVINTGSVFDEAVFREPDSLLKRPLAEGALYLENTRIQYIHVLCLARPGGEHDQLVSAASVTDDDSADVNWPDGFADLIRKERTGEIPPDLQAMKSESGDDPNHVFPLRDAESQYKVELHQGPECLGKGSLSGAQVMREAYPGAVYYYATQPLRVYKVMQPSKTIMVRTEKRYTTKPQNLPTLIYPNLSYGNVHRALEFGELIVSECNLQVREAICGYQERRGNNQLNIPYPLDYVKSGLSFNLQRFTRNFFTTGALLSHPALDGAKATRDVISALLYEAFLMTLPFERQDINFAVDRHRIARGPITEGRCFIALYDQVYGSLRLSGRLCEPDSLRLTLRKCLELAQNDENVGAETIRAIEQMIEALDQDPRPVSFGVGETGTSIAAARERVILPVSVGLSLRHGNEEFVVEKILFHPRVNGLAYRGRHRSTPVENVAEFLAIQDLAEVPGESKMGWYDYDTGDVVPDVSSTGPGATEQVSEAEHKTPAAPGIKISFVVSPRD
jgi:DEAD/DEAH box helicase domain-containing protein